MAVTPERRAELEAELDRLMGLSPPKPKVVASDGRIVRDADVHVSPADERNSLYGTREVVSVRRPDDFRYAKIDMALAEVQMQERQRAASASAPPDRIADPMNLWGGRQDD
jgi:hypothetical protein